MCQHLPAPKWHKILHITMMMGCCFILEQNDTMLKRFRLFTVKSPPHLILQECTVKLATDPHTNWYEGHWSIFQLKNMTCTTLRAPWLCHAIFFLSDVWECQSTFCLFSWGWNECIHDSSTIKMQSRTALFSFLQHCRQMVTRRIHMGLWSLLSTCGIHSAQTFVSPSCWWRYGKHLLQIQTSAENAMHETLCMWTRKDFAHSTWYSSISKVWAPLWGESSLSSLSFLTAFTHHMKQHVSLSLPSMTCNTSEHFYPIKHEIVNILMTVRQKLPRTLSQSTAKHQLTSQKQCTFVTVQPHTLLEFGHTKHCRVLPAYTKLQEWPMHDDTKHYHELQNHVYVWHINLWDPIHKLTKELFNVLWNTP